MSCSYADGLTPYKNKGKCGLPEKFDDDETVTRKVKQLLEWIKVAKHVTVHTGAGISTAAGIPDFRPRQLSLIKKQALQDVSFGGPKGVWTLEKKGEKPTFSKSFDNAEPSIAHMCLKALYNANFIHGVVSQNVDGLHLKSGFPRVALAELHGNVFIQQCALCERQLVAGHAVPSVGQKCLNIACPFKKANGRTCRGKLHDTILDWEDNLPAGDLLLAEKISREADLSIALGSTLQIVPSGNLPLASKKNKGRFVICNLQRTKHDELANLIINSYVDKVLSLLCKYLEIEVPKYSKEDDLTFKARNKDLNLSLDKLEWTLPLNSLSLKPQNSPNKGRKRLKKDNSQAIELIDIKEEKSVESIQKSVCNTRKHLPNGKNVKFEKVDVSQL